MSKKILFVLLVFAAAYISISAALSFDDQTSPWEVPDEYVNKENPYEANKESLKIGKQIWSKHCASCHGKEGFGDGSKAAQLDTPAGDFTTEEFQSQTDGTIFYKSKFGRDEMPSFEKKIPYDEDIWHVVNYMREFE